MGGEDKEMITCRGRGKPEREMAVYVAKAVTGKTNREIGAFGEIKGSAVSEVIRREERKFEKDEYFRQEILELKDSLVN